MTNAHVRGRPDEGVRYRVDEFTRHAKVADLDFALGVEQNVRRFDIC